MIKSYKRIPVKQLLLYGFLPSFLKKMIYRLKGYKIGQKVKIGFGSVILGREVQIGEGSKIGFFSIILCKKCQLKEGVEVGSFVYMKVDKIVVDSHTVIRENNLFGGMDIGKSELRIGAYSHIHQKCFINTTMPVEIGSNTAIGGGSYLFTHSSWQSVLKGYPCSFKPIKVGNNVWISWSCFLLPGVEIGDNSLIGGRSYVTKSIPPNCLATGNPAKVVIPSGMYPRSINSEEQNDLFVKILDDFRNFLETKDITTTLEIKNNDYWLSINRGNTTDFKYVYSHKLEENNHVGDENCIIISFGIKKEFKESLINRNVYWIDLNAMEKHGINKYMKELLTFLKHYGLRFREVK